MKKALTAAAVAVAFAAPSAMAAEGPSINVYLSVSGNRLVTAETNATANTTQDQRHTQGPVAEAD